MSASKRVLIVGIDADRCWYNNRYVLVIFQYIAEYREIVKQYASLPAFTEENITELNMLKTSMLAVIHRHKEMNIAEMDRDSEANYKNYQTQKIIKPGMTSDGLLSAIYKISSDFLNDIKCVDAKTRHQEGYTFHFLLAAIANIPMIAHILNMQESFDELKLASTSSRLAPQLEYKAIQMSPCGSIYQDITELGKLLQNLLPRKRVDVNKYTPLDAIRRELPGHQFERSIESYWDNYKKPYVLPCRVDTTKFTQYYGVIHSCIAADPSAQYQAVFFDDLETIEEGLKSSLKKHGETFTQLIPCPLTWHRYEGNINSTLTIAGTGSYNSDYSDTVTKTWLRYTSYSPVFDWLKLFLDFPEIGSYLLGTSAPARERFFSSEMAKPGSCPSSSAVPTSIISRRN